MSNTDRRPIWIRFLTQPREPVNSITHGMGAILALFGMIWLIWMARSFPGRATALAVFGTTMVLLYTASWLHHHYDGPDRIQEHFHRLDHAAIYLLIAGSYTPFTYTFLVDDPMWRWGMLIAIWSLAVIGVILKLGFNMYGHVSTLFYVLMGWMVVIGIPKFIASDYAPALWMIAAGGIVYTLGAVIFALRKPNFHQHFGYHELWHLFVLGGSICHFIAAAIWVA